MKRKILSLSVIVVLIACIAASFILLSKKPDISKITKAQQIAEFTKPAVVRIVDGVYLKWRYDAPSDGTYYIDSKINTYLKSINNETNELYAGSGAIINPNGYIITNAHVVNVSKMEDSKITENHLAFITTALAKDFNVSYDVMYNYLKRYLKVDSITKVLKVVLPGGEILDGEIKSFGAPAGEGKDVAVVKIEKSNLPTLTLGDSTKVSLQESIWVFGYPGAADSSFFTKESILVVSITDGKISAIDKKSAQGAPVFQINAAATHGNSGGPVIGEDGAVIGLLTFTSENNTNETQGFNFIVPVATVKEFVSQAGAANVEGDVDKLYKEGLKLYWGGYYKDALKNFESIQRLNPNHSEIKKLISECQSKSSDSKILWSNYKVIFIIVDVFSGILIVVAFLFGFVLGKNKAPKANPVINNAPNMEINKEVINEPIKEAPIAKPVTNNIRPLLCGISGPFANTTMELSFEPTALGRDGRICKVVFPPEAVEIGRKHCMISYDSENKLFILEDCSSNNGTFLGNGQRLNPNEKTYLRSGDSFYLTNENNLFEVWLE